MCEHQDPLVFVPEEMWCELQEVFKADWPRSISGYEALDVQRRWRERGLHNDFKVYCAYGDVKSGMVVFNGKEGYYEVIILCPRDDTQKLEDVLKETKLIDWNREFIVPFIPPNLIECLDKVMVQVGVEVTDIKRMETLVLEEATFDDISLPPGVTFGHLTLEHLDIVDSTWPRRYPKSSTYFRLLINAKSSYALYHNNVLVCWVLFREVGSLQHLYTLEEHRGKGYAEMLLRKVCKIWMKDGRPVFGYCYKDNASACKLYQKLGFVRTQSIVWYFINKINK